MTIYITEALLETRQPIDLQRLRQGLSPDSDAANVFNAIVRAELVSLSPPAGRGEFDDPVGAQNAVQSLADAYAQHLGEGTKGPFGWAPKARRGHHFTVLLFAGPRTFESTASGVERRFSERFKEPLDRAEAITLIALPMASASSPWPLRVVYAATIVLFTFLLYDLVIRPPIPRGNRHIGTRKEATAALPEVYAGMTRTAYCGCPFNPETMQADKNDCGYTVDTKVEWVHVVPVSDLGRGSEFKFRAADLYNLMPSLSSLQRARAATEPGEVEDEPKRFGECDFEVRGGRFEPPEDVRGDIARTYQYMADAYPNLQFMTPRLKKVLGQWGEDDPVSRDECRRAARIAERQRNENRFVVVPCQKKNLYRPE